MDPATELLEEILIFQAKENYDHGIIDEKIISLAVGLIILDTLKENGICPV